MKSLIRQLLFEQISEPEQRGRLIKFDVDEPDIMVATGVLEDRIVGLMCMRSYPMTAKEISTGIGSNPSQVNRGLKQLISQSRVEVIEIPGSVKEFILKSD